MLRSIGAPEILLVLLVVVLLFGAKRLPDTARGLGRSLRIFKSELKAASDDDDPEHPKQITQTVAAPPVVPPAAPVATPAPVDTTPVAEPHSTDR
jgi:sec-independent protein translocase protein TatA